MRPHSPLSFALVAIMAGTAFPPSTSPGAADSPNPLAAPPAVERSLVARGQGHFPVAIRLKDGRIAVVFRGGAPHLGIGGRLDVTFSADEGKTWTKPAVAADSPADDRNPAFGQAADGTLVLAYWRTARYDDKGHYDEHLDKPVNTWVTRSTDGGKTWSESAEIDVSDIGYGSPYGRILTLDDGSMLMAVYGGPLRKAGAATKPAGAAAPARDCSYLFRSADAGKTWRRHALIAAGYNETGLVRLRSGELLAAMRSEKAGDVWLTRSRDGGEHWEEPKQLTPANVHPSDLILLGDGRVLLTCGDRTGPFGVDAVVGSADGHFDWADRFPLVTDAVSRDCGYPSSVLLEGGRVLTVYYATGSKEHKDWGTHCGAAVFQPPQAAP